MTTSFQESVERLLAHCADRTQDILVRRFGIGGHEPETLQSIGDDYNITRERVRQVEADGLKTLRDHQNDVDESVAALMQSFDQYGGLLSEQQLRDVVAGGEDDVAASVTLLLTVSDRFEHRRENSMFTARWVTDANVDDRARSVVAAMTAFLEQAGNPVSWNEMVQAVGDDVPEPFVDAVVRAAKNVDENVFGEYGLASWPEVSPRGVRDKAYLVLARHGDPLHFTEIATKINEAAFDEREAHVQTVHNELIKDDRFVLVGRGLYAARDWGYKPGTVEDVIERTLRNSNDPLSRDEVVDAVLAQRHVQRNTVLLNLQNSDKFMRLDDGRYTVQAGVEEA